MEVINAANYAKFGVQGRINGALEHNLLYYLITEKALCSKHAKLNI
jgi:hypothetical protein